MNHRYQNKNMKNNILENFNSKNSVESDESNNAKKITGKKGE